MSRTYRKDAEPEAGDAAPHYSTDELEQMDSAFIAALRRAHPDREIKRDELQGGAL